jgi:AcrR family transcriptional regulator
MKEKSISNGIKTRKSPKQARSSELVSVILEAAIQVLERDGSSGFTTSSIAERAGVSIGSLYQYFPNKASILYKLQSEEWVFTQEHLKAILTNEEISKDERLKMMIFAFMKSEYDEILIRNALTAIEPLYMRTKESLEIKIKSNDILNEFISGYLENKSNEMIENATKLIETSMRSIGKRISNEAENIQYVEKYAMHLYLMIHSYLNILQSK